MKTVVDLKLIKYTTQSRGLEQHMTVAKRSLHSNFQNSVEVLKINGVPRFWSIKLIESKLRPPNFKKQLTKAEFNNEEAAVKVPRFAKLMLRVVVTIQRI